MIGAKMMLEGKWKKTGVWNMEQIDPDPLRKTSINTACPGR